MPHATVSLALPRADDAARRNAPPSTTTAEGALWRVAVVAWTLSALSAPWTGWRPHDVRAYAIQAVCWAVLWLPVVVVRANDRRRPAARALLRTARALWRHPGRNRACARVLSSAGAVGLTLVIFAGWKQRIGVLVPFWADPWLAGINAALHGGHPPAVWLVPALGPRVLPWIDLWYFPGWMLTNTLALSAVLWAVPDARRARLLLTITLAWLVLGVLAALGCASAGPWAWPQVVGGADPFGPANAVRAAAGPLIGQHVQAWLWAHYTGAVAFPGWGAGISAMPSLHVGMSGCVLLVARTYGGRTVQALAWVALALTLVGSIATGMHYAIDGYAALVGVALLWKLAGAVTEAA